MKKLALTLAIGIFSLGAVSAQNVKQDKVKSEMDANRKQKVRKTPEQRAAYQTEKLTKELNLSTTQSAQIKEAMLRKNSQMQALKAKHGDNKEAMKADMKAVRTTWHNDLKAILTPEQMTKYQAMKKENHGKHKGHQQGKHGDHKNKGDQKNKKD